MSVAEFVIARNNSGVITIKRRLKLLEWRGTRSEACLRSNASFQIYIYIQRKSLILPLLKAFSIKFYFKHVAFREITAEKWLIKAMPEFDFLLEFKVKFLTNKLYDPIIFSFYRTSDAEFKVLYFEV